MTRLISKLLAIPAIGPPIALFAAVFAICALFWGATTVAGAQHETTADREAAMKAFTDRVKAYVDVKKKLQTDLPKPKPGDRGTGRAEATEDTLAARLQAARKEAKPGEVFGDVAPIFRRIIQHDTETRGIRDAYAAMQEVPASNPPAVNASYPEKAALATVPPLILVNLPRLPDGLEYRFMGRDLILRDREANIIVDFIPGAVPVLKR